MNKKAKVEARKVRMELERKRLPNGEVQSIDYYPALWSQMAKAQRFEVRQGWLTKAGWDAAWVFHNWNELPHNLKHDLCMVPLESLEPLIIGERK